MKFLSETFSIEKYKSKKVILLFKNSPISLPEAAWMQLVPVRRQELLTAEKRCEGQRLHENLFSVQGWQHVST